MACTHNPKPMKLGGKSVCYDCYLAYYLDRQHRKDDGWKFSALDPTHKAALGKRLRAHVANPIIGSGEGVLVKTAGISWEPVLDRLAEKLVIGTCTAVCFYNTSLVVAENDVPPSEPKVREKLAELKEDIIHKDIPRIIRLGVGTSIVHHRSVLTGASSFPVDVRAAIHAELRILEYLHLALPDVAAPEDRPVYYVGISKGSCAKCETIFRAYNGWASSRFIAVNRGFHSSYDFQWKLPHGLAGLKNSVGYFALKNSLS